jgi:hypothetical protein
MAYTEPPLVVTGDTIPAALWNTYVRLNFRAAKGTDGPFTFDNTYTIAGAASVGTGLTVAGGINLTSGGMAGNAAVRTYLPAQGFVPLAAVGQPFVDSGGPQYELEYYANQDGYATTKLAIPWNFQGGTIRFRVRYYTPTASQQVTWRVGGATYGIGSSARTGWGAIVDVNATSWAGGYGLSESIHNWVGLPSSYAGAEIKMYLQRLGAAASWDTSGDSAFCQSVFVEFGV